MKEKNFTVILEFKKSGSKKGELIYSRSREIKEKLN